MNTVVIYPGRFHPFHKGHASVYNALVKQFGKDHVWIATSNVIDPPKSPFSFTEKRDMMALTGVDPSRVVQTKNPYQATEITDNYDPQNTIALFAVSEKDMAEDPRFSFKPKRDGSLSYYQPAQKDMRPFAEHGYILTVPVLDFKVLGQPMRSATEFRRDFAAADSDKQKAMITDLFGRYDPNVHKTMAAKIVEQLIRADEILDKLIELGADDVYIVEACARVDMLKNKVLKEQSRKTLYQAIMEGGHSLPEEITDFDKENPMDSVIAIRGIGTMRIGQALDKIAEILTTMAKIAGSKNARDIQTDLDYNMDLVHTYLDSVQEAYRELAQQRKRGGTASRGIDKDITERYEKGKPALLTFPSNTLVVDTPSDLDWYKIGEFLPGIIAGSDEEPYELGQEDTDVMINFPDDRTKEIIKRFLDKQGITYKEIDGVGHPEVHAQDANLDEGKKPWFKDGVPMCSKECCGAPVMECTCPPDCAHCNCSELKKMMESETVDYALNKVAPGMRPLVRTALVKYPFAKDELTAVLHLLNDQLKADKQQSADISRLDKENDSQDKDIDQVEKDIKNLTFAREHCGDPMADDHKPVRMLLMKLYQKEMECVPGSPEHFEVMQMIDGCRKNIGLDENLEEAWSEKYKRSINCDNPRGFSQRAHCDGRKKNEGILDTVTGYVKDTIKKRQATFSGSTKKQKKAGV